jgi:MerR family transcriptional regulator, thiopeptide resistance regulator
MSIEKIIPLLVYEDIVAAQQFLVKAFGFREGRLERDGSGVVVHAEVHHGDDVIWIHRVTAAHGLSAPRQEEASSGLVIHVTDVDAHYERARAAGAKIDSEPTNQEYGQREYGARDLEGNRWWFATPA